MKDIDSGRPAYVVSAISHGLTPSSTIITGGSVITTTPLPIEDTAAVTHQEVSDSGIIDDELPL